MVKNLPVNAGDMGLIPSLGTKIPLPPRRCKAAEPRCLNYWAHTLEPVLHNKVLSATNQRGVQNCQTWWSACQFRGHSFDPWSGKISHAAEQ